MPKKSARKKGTLDTPSNLLTPIHLPVAKTKDNPSPSTQPKPKRIIKKPTGFLNLPPEIRNQIYGYYFQQDFRCEFAGKDARLGYKYTDENGIEKLTPRMEFQPRGIKQAPLTAVRFSGKLGTYTRTSAPPTNWSQSLTPLPLTSLTLSLETTPLLYHTTTFTFDAPSRIHSFLSLPASLLVHVSKIHLHYSPYGDPQSLAHEIYARKHVDSWDKACAALATRLVNLRELDVWINVAESRVYLSMAAPYLRPLARFRRVQGTAEAGGKVKVNVRVDSRWTRRGAFAVEELGVHAGELHRLFGEGVARGVMGGREEECMRGFREYWGGPCWGWQEHLRFGDVG